MEAFEHSLFLGLDHIGRLQWLEVKPWISLKMTVISDKKMQQLFAKNYKKVVSVVVLQEMVGWIQNDMEASKARKFIKCTNTM